MESLTGEKGMHLSLISSLRSIRDVLLDAKPLGQSKKRSIPPSSRKGSIELSLANNVLTPSWKIQFTGLIYFLINLREIKRAIVSENDGPFCRIPALKLQLYLRARIFFFYYLVASYTTPRMLNTVRNPVTINLFTILAYGKFNISILWAKNVRPKNVFYDAITSVPCFEYWLLLHFVFTVKPFARSGKRSPADMVIHELKRHMPEYKKDGRDIFSQFIAYTDDAIKHAECANQQATQDGTDNPSTHVHKLVE